MTRDWMASAACLDEDPELFFPVGGSGEEAKRICARCPVQPECETHANRVGARGGIWAGRSARHLASVAKADDTPPEVQLSDRDARVLTLTGQGLTAEDISRIVGVTRRTVVRIRARHRSEVPA